MDIECALCGEPWDAYGVHHRLDMTEEEAYLFLSGQGCPACHFGQDKERLLPNGNFQRFLGSLIDTLDDGD